MAAREAMNLRAKERELLVRFLLPPLAVALLLFSPSVIRSQSAPISPQRGWQVPSGTPGCSVEKSCAELAPAMTKSALGPSPLEENLRYLSDNIGGRLTGTPEADRAVGWRWRRFAMPASMKSIPRNSRFRLGGPKDTRPWKS